MSVNTVSPRSDVLDVQQMNEYSSAVDRPVGSFVTGFVTETARGRLRRGRRDEMRASRRP
jgi:hypothetical protein